MEFKLEANGIHIVCCSPVWTQKMIDWGARLVEPRQADELSAALETTVEALEARDVSDSPDSVKN